MAALTPEGPLSVVVLDDHPAVLRTVTALARSWGWTILASSTSGHEALTKIEELQPTVAVLDVHVRDLSGIEIAKQARRTAPHTQIVFYSAAVEPAIVREALDVGATGFVGKEAALDELRRAVEAAQRSERYVDPLVGAQLLIERSTAQAALTARERDVLRLLASGGSYDEIARKLVISAETVRTHVAKAVRKLGARTRTEAIANALRQGIIS